MASGLYIHRLPAMPAEKGTATTRNRHLSAMIEHQRKRHYLKTLLGYRYKCLSISFSSIIEAVPLWRQSAQDFSLRSRRNKERLDKFSRVEQIVTPSRGTQQTTPPFFRRINPHRRGREDFLRGIKRINILKGGETVSPQLNRIFYPLALRLVCLITGE